MLLSDKDNSRFFIRAGKHYKSSKILFEHASLMERWSLARKMTGLILLRPRLPAKDDPRRHEFHYRTAFEIVADLPPTQLPMFSHNWSQTIVENMFHASLGQR